MAQFVAKTAHFTKSTVLDHDSGWITHPSRVFPESTRTLVRLNPAHVAFDGQWSQILRPSSLTKRRLWERPS